MNNRRTTSGQVAGSVRGIAWTNQRRHRLYDRHGGVCFSLFRRSVLFRRKTMAHQRLHVQMFTSRFVGFVGRVR